jgi:hypothetical protein
VRASARPCRCITPLHVAHGRLRECPSVRLVKIMPSRHRLGVRRRAVLAVSAAAAAARLCPRVACVARIHCTALGMIEA